ncbi:hypothetical protein [Sphaerobacter thermophilus]|uniref:Uncharacterized protein n=1 Tax=Sphaerobacter thermophilus (strain ATCC 49802 / DSM 20745 / KCCM 41009 / NCIMB 13125 / S 6022) TaxID=479434 RepID=D1C3U8_SPHTD|nr:hypothetical protein [Sphaerobacter thermophilus]ACZ38915.1 hypothetical protein Sthe_1480 [Sphaerobacter thermophilus DSM 20745]ACZ39658.1 hypothetical protein Sthe_2236 [Sphaerobacter thermophilus DSM 20745]MBX6723077.1 hypothetical protein [Dactylosporangium sp.]
MATRSDQCTATRRDGGRCTARALPGRPYCFAHDPELQAERTEARRRGGRNRAKVVRLRRLVPPRLLPVFDQLEQALRDVLGGSLEPRRAMAAASVARALVDVLQAGELEERLRKLEEAAQGEDVGRRVS